MNKNVNFKNIKQKTATFIGGRNFASGVLVALIIAAVVFVNIICYTVTEYFQLYLYQPDTPDFTVSDTFSELFQEKKSAGHTVSVTFCMDEADLEKHSTGSYVRETAKKFAEKYDGFIELRFVNLITLTDDKGTDVSSEMATYDKYLKDNPGLYGNAGRLDKTSVIFRSGDRFKILTDTVTAVGFADFYTLDSSKYVTSYKGEETFAAMVSWVLKSQHGTAYFTTGHGEVPNATLVNLLSLAGYEVSTINLRDSRISADEMKEKLDGAALILISNPTSDFEKAMDSTINAELTWLEYYAGRGGSFFVTVDPYFTKLSNLYSFLSEYGVSLLDSEDGLRQTIKDMDNGITTDGFTIVADFADGDVAAAMKSKLADGGRVILRDVAPVKLDANAGAKPLLTTSPSSTCFAGGEVTDTEGEYTIATYSDRLHDTGKTSKLFFIPSVYLTATDAMVTNGYSNKDFVYSLIDVYYGLGDMPYGCNSIVYDNQVLENLTMGTARIYTAIMIAIPAALAVFGAVMLIRRKNR